MEKMKSAFMTLLVLIFGLAPLLLLLAWVERNMAIPGLGTLLMEWGYGLPWVFVEGGAGYSAAYGIVVNIGLLLTFAVFHIVFSRILSRNASLIAGGLGAIFLIGLWQPSGVVLYQLIPSALVASLVSFFLFWTFLGLAWKTRKVVLFTGLAWFLTPMMSLDRLIFGAFALVFVATLTFLSPGKLPGRDRR